MKHSDHVAECERLSDQLEQERKSSKDVIETANKYQADWEKAADRVRELEKAQRNYHNLLLTTAARFARWEFVMNIEGCRTISDVRGAHETHESRHVEVAFELKKELDAIAHPPSIETNQQ